MTWNKPSSTREPRNSSKPSQETQAIQPLKVSQPPQVARSRSSSKPSTCEQAKQTLLPENKLQNAQKRQLYIRTQIHIAVKTKTLPILTSNETGDTAETQPNFDFLEPPRELMKIAFKNRTVREITAFDWGEGNDFWFELSGGSKTWGFEKSGFHCTCFETLHTPSLWLLSTALVKSGTYKRNS